MFVVAYNAVGNRQVDSLRITGNVNRIADVYFFIGKCKIGCSFLGRVDLQYGKVIFFIYGKHRSAIVFIFCGRADEKVSSAFQHMMIGGNHAIGVKKETTAAGDGVNVFVCSKNIDCGLT